MSYTTLDKIVGQLSEQTVIQLTDDDGLNQIVTDRVDEAIADAEALIDGYCSGRYVVPFEPVPAIVAKCGLDIAIYNLYARRVETMPDVRQKNYDNALKLLGNISTGSVLLGATATQPAPDSSTATTGMVVTPGRKFSRITMDGY